MSICVIADLHLSESRWELVAAFEAFCKRRLNRFDTLIIAGDFFDFFVGVDPKSLLHSKIKDIISRLKERGVDVMFIRGNRDFLIDGKAAAFFGFKLLDDMFTIENKSGRILILHGDELCTKDKAFCRFRKISRSKMLQKLFRCLPFSIKNKIGSLIRGKSSRQDANRHLHPEEYGLVQSEACKLLKSCASTIMVHGHFHVFGSEKNFCQVGFTRLGLGSWGQYCSCVIIDDQGATLLQFPVAKLHAQ